MSSPGQVKIVYIGITNDPERREAEHRAEGKVFRTFHVVPPRVTKAGAEMWEEERLASYRRNHKGKNPKYNTQSR